MTLRVLRRWLLFTMFSTVFGISSGHAQTLGSVFQMMGGMDAVSKLASGLLQSAASDPRLAGVVGKMDMKAASPTLANQMCALLGGGCKAPLTDQQMTVGASKLNATQTKAVSENFSSVLGNVITNPLAKEGVSKAIGPKLGGIMGALL